MDIIKLTPQEFDIVISDTVPEMTPFSPFLEYFSEALETGDEELIEAEKSLKERSLLPSPKQLRQAIDILAAPEGKISVMSRMFEISNMADFYFRNRHLANFAFNEEGICFVHKPQTKIVFTAQTIELFENFFSEKPEEQDKEPDLKYTFTFEEYIIFSAICHLENMFELIGEDEETGPLSFTKEDILECIAEKDRFKNIAILSSLEMLDLDDFYDNFDDLTEEIIKLFLSYEYIRETEPDSYRIAKFATPLYETVSSVTKIFLTISAEYYNAEDGSIANLAYSFLAGADTVYHIKSENATLNFYQIYSDIQLQKIFESLLTSPY